MEIKLKLEEELRKIFEANKTKSLEQLKPMKAQDLKQYNELVAKIEAATFDDFVQSVLVSYCRNAKVPELQEQKKAELMQELKDYSEDLTK